MPARSPFKYTLFALVAILLSSTVMFIIAESVVRLTPRSPVLSTWLQMHDRGFMQNMPSVSRLHTLRDIRVRYSISSARTRGSEPLETDHNTFVFGDSFTFGLLLQEEDTFLHHLNSMQSKTTYVNAGIGGTGLADWVVMLETYGSEWPVDAILIIHNYDDFVRMFSKNLYVLQDGEMIPSVRWRETRLKRMMDSSRLWVWMQERSRLITFVQRLLWDNLYFIDISQNRPELRDQYPPLPTFETNAELKDYFIDLTEAYYDLLLELSIRLDIPVTVITTGFISEQIPEFGVYNQFVFDHLSDILENRGIQFNDITPELLEITEQDLSRIQIPGDGHPTAEGAFLMARIMGEYLHP
ncbi:MAG: hypothetical protein LAT67_05370 [Balneolales bacterium]|nr:hypothetical protein [Balneolales bacterium]